MASDSRSATIRPNSAIPSFQKAADTQMATLIPNTAIAGKVGVVLGMPFGVALPVGTRQIVTIRFDVAANVFGGPTPLVMGDTPVFREVSDVNASVLDFKLHQRRDQHPRSELGICNSRGPCPNGNWGTDNWCNHHDHRRNRCSACRKDKRI